MPPAMSPMMFFDLWKDMSQHSYTFWAQAAAPFAVGAAPDFLQSVQKHWAEQLEILAQQLAHVMGTEAFAALQSKCLEQQLAWQETLVKALQPHIDVVLRACNLPSREQTNRLFERVIGLEDRLDSLEAMLRQCLGRMSAAPGSTLTDDP